MRRTDRQITDIDEIKDIVERAKVVHLGMIDGERPYVVPLHYGCEWRGACLTLWCHGAREGRKLDVLRANPTVFVGLDCDMEIASGGDVACRYGSYYASVMGDGIATIVEDPAEKTHGLRCLMRTQAGREFDIPEQAARAVSVIRIDVRDVTAKGRKKAAG